jgi:hypothetical protein
MSGFKLIAIQVLSGCDARFYKNLKKNTFYNFYCEHELLKKNGLSSYKWNPENAVDLYNINSSNGNKISVSISAIIGKNGSGKSTLTELFYLYVFLCNYKQIMAHKIKTHNEKFFNIELHDSFNEIISKNISNNLNAKLDSSVRASSFFDELLFFKDYDAVFEVYYYFSENIYQISIDTRKKHTIDWYAIKIWRGSRFQELSKKDDHNPTPYYSIALNYSIHGLNTIDYGPWLNRIFHKNDSYQTPLVINPKREEGNIDINNENDLQKSRLLANIIISRSKGLLESVVFNKKRHRKILISFSDKVIFRNFHEDLIPLLELESDGMQVEASKKAIKVLNRVCRIFSIPNYDELNEIEKLCLRYSANKLSKIRKTYFKESGERYNIADIASDKSHVTFKLHQSINFIKGNSILKQQLQTKLKGQINETISGFENIEIIKKVNIELNDLYDLISIPVDKNRDDLIQEGDLIHYLLPPIFDYNILFSNSKSDTLNNLSSGEKQQMYTLHTIMYHMRNLSSKHPDNINKYKNINLILDEIELYYHPELQRRFIKNLLNHIESLHFSTKDIESINIILATHSPFITSDIASQNILRLENGEPKKITDVQSFGSNIHDLLADGFYLSNFLGEFAKSEIENAIKCLNNPNRNLSYNPGKVLKLIEVIGDPIIKNRIIDLYREAFPPKRIPSLDDERKELIKKLAEIDELIKEENDQN